MENLRMIKEPERKFVPCGSGRSEPLVRRMALLAPERPGQIYALDFVMDTVLGGRRFK
jgi:hypothetical protein